MSTIITTNVVPGATITTNNDTTTGSVASNVTIGLQGPIGPTGPQGPAGASTATTDASLLTSGTLADARLSNIVTAATVGSSTLIPVITYDTKGRITATTTAAASGGGANVTNLTTSSAPTTVTINSDTGTDAIIPATDVTNAGLLLPAEKTKLTGIATGATANSTDAFLLARANHTGTQAVGTITGLAAVATSGLKADVGLGNVDNTSDASKPISTATQTALNAKKTDSMSTNRLLGRGTAATGVIEEIILGTNLSLTGTTLNAAGGGGSSTAIQDEGVAVTQRAILNFIGTTVTAADDTPNTRTNVTISAEAPITAGTTAQYYRGDKSFQTLNSAAVPELTNLYYTEGRVSANTTVASAAQTAGAGLTKTGTTFDVIGTLNRITVTADAVDIGTDVTTNAGTQTLTNKTLTSPVINTPTGITKTDVGLANVDNTSDATKNAATVTLTNKRIDQRVVSAASTATLTPDIATTDLAILTAQAVALTIAAPTGTPTQGSKLMIRIKDNATAQTITYNAIYRAVGVTLPTTTTISKTLYLGAVYNSTDTKWDVLAVGLEA